MTEKSATKTSTDTLTPALRQLLTLAHEDEGFRSLLLEAPTQALAAAEDGSHPAFARWAGVQPPFTRVSFSAAERDRVLAAAPASHLRELRDRLVG
ncbi:MAG: hypothetical protein AVDCRST_MAG77-61 [uncultured Chloroflexi bacterium]|uniref:Uncharacterized protein n=1 Tax=uncultured Chloroflexota bacterium TaxID=166587 RepID=A0A6J4H5C9_9CHLR|nr:MAG: hypothetical protein AVDCRST_MAG77-61 [uncultured Chloroflexota bacterium]